MSVLSVVIGITAGVIVVKVISNKQITNLKNLVKEKENENEKLKKDFEKWKKKYEEYEEFIKKRPAPPAKIVFSENINKFIPLLRGVSEKQIPNQNEWTEVIVDINNFNLCTMWKKAYNRPDLWITYLQSFGLHRNVIGEFKALDYYKEMYETKDGEIELGKTYKVISPCWLFTDENNKKSVVLKGIVVLKNE